MTRRVKRWRAYVWIMSSVHWAVQNMLWSWNHLLKKIKIKHTQNSSVNEPLHFCKMKNLSKYSHRLFKNTSISVQHYPGDISQVWQPLSTQYTVRRDVCVYYSHHSGTFNSTTFLCTFKVWKEQGKKKKTRRQKGDGQKETASLCGHKWNNYT